jgi:hypothetical protein
MACPRCDAGRQPDHNQLLTGRLRPRGSLAYRMAGGELRDSGRKAGFWLEEFAAPYYVFKDVLASVLCIIIDQVPQVDRAVNTVHRHSTLPGFEHCDSRLHIDTSKRHQWGPYVSPTLTFRSNRDRRLHCRDHGKLLERLSHRNSVLVNADRNRIVDQSIQGAQDRGIHVRCRADTAQ